MTKGQVVTHAELKSHRVRRRFLLLLFHGRLLTVSGGQFRVCGSQPALKSRAFALLAFALEGRFFSDGTLFQAAPKKKLKIPRDFFVEAQEKKL